MGERQLGFAEAFLDPRMLAAGEGVRHLPVSLYRQNAVPLIRLLRSPPSPHTPGPDT